MVSTAPRLSPAPACAHADNSVAVRSVTGPRTDCAKFCRAEAVLLLLEFAHADHETRDTIVAIEREQPFGKLARLFDIAVGQHREEGAAEQIRVARIELKHVEVIGRGGGGIALGAGMAGGQIAAGGIFRRKLSCARRLGGKREGKLKAKAMPRMAACRDSSE